MKENEKKWLEAYNNGRFKIDFETGLVTSYSQRNPEGYVLGSGNKKGNLYIRSTLCINGEDFHILLHRFIWIVANGDIPEKIEVNHKNGIKYDNRLENLELTNKSGNALHSRRVLGNKGGVVKGEDCFLSKLKETDVINIRNEYATGKYNLRYFAILYNVSDCTIGELISGKTWKHVGGIISKKPGRGNIKVRKKPNRFIKLTKEEVFNIKILLKENKLWHWEIAEMFNVSRGMITAINNNRVWNDIKIKGE